MDRNISYMRIIHEKFEKVVGNQNYDVIISPFFSIAFLLRKNHRRPKIINITNTVEAMTMPMMAPTGNLLFLSFSGSKSTQKQILESS